MKIRWWFWCGLILISACEFGDTNINPVRPTTASLEELLPIAIAQTYRNINSIGGRVTGIIMQYYKGVDAQPLNYEQYLIDERTLDDFWKTGLYVGAMRDCQLIMAEADQTSAFKYAGIARVLLAHNLGLATAFWGEVPFSEAFKGADELHPVYDGQEFVYEQIHELLLEAISNLEQGRDSIALSADLVFQGNKTDWIATAYALLARYNLHLSKRRPEALDNVLEYTSNSTLSSHERAPVFNYLNNRNGGNPFALYFGERSGQIVLGSFLSELLVAADDPRLPKIGRPDGEDFMMFDSDDATFFWTQLDTPIPLISHTELEFITAEAQLRLGHIEAAEQAFKAAVSSHLLQMNSEPTAHNEWLEAHIHFSDCPDFETQLEKLITQKYIALFVQGAHEAWNDYRRTSYPALVVPEQANSSFNPSLIIPRRYLYPISERNANFSEYEAAIDRQGGHFMDVDMWMFAE